MYFLALLDGVVRAFQAMRGRCPRPRARRSRDRAHRPVSGLPGGAAGGSYARAAAPDSCVRAGG